LERNIAWSNKGRKGQCRLFGTEICDLLLVEGYEAVPTPAELDRLVIDIGSAVLDCYNGRAYCGFGKLYFEKPSCVFKRKGRTSAWDEALQFFCISLWSPSKMFGCDSPRCMCGAKLESNGYQTSATSYRGLLGDDQVIYYGKWTCWFIMTHGYVPLLAPAMQPLNESFINAGHVPIRQPMEVCK